MQIKQLPHNHGSLPANIAAEMPGAETFGPVSDIFKTLCDGRRLQLFWLLCHCEECVVNLSTLLGLSSPALSHHLKQLKAAGLVVSKREGKEVHYTHADTPRVRALHTIIEDIVELTCPAGNALSAEVPDDTPIGVVTEIREYLLEDLSRRVTVDELARRFHINPTTLKAEFKRVFGMPVATYVRAARMRRAMELLRTTNNTIAQIAAETGYASQGKFTEAFTAATGTTPREYRALYRPAAGSGSGDSDGNNSSAPAAHANNQRDTVPAAPDSAAAPIPAPEVSL